uniref:Uncharacterized protein n=1 Tax=virus sp. ctrcb4 TaxID=2825824 RepID=A0A8S5RPU6_9VIRU|nr:MAG TPA: hypothetical protein [virus sp. ctrcb4]DAR12727.1 MAG TPA: hypothetical protein [Crassvirales sp.]
MFSILVSELFLLIALVISYSAHLSNFGSPCLASTS